MAVFLTVLVVCALAAWNVWPFPAWELFSRLRTDQQTGWELVAVDAAGHEHRDPIVSLAHGYRGFGFLMTSFAERSAAERDAICAAWLRGAVDGFGSSTRLLRIYQLRWRLSDRRRKRTAAAQRSLAWVCTTEGAHPAG